MRIQLLLGVALLLSLPASALQNPNTRPQRADAPQTRERPPERGPRQGWRMRERQRPRFCPHCGHSLRRFEQTPRTPRQRRNERR